jgi:hypothetical protein
MVGVRVILAIFISGPPRAGFIVSGGAMRATADWILQAVDRAVEEVIHQASDLARVMDRKMREMRAA